MTRCSLVHRHSLIYTHELCHFIQSPLAVIKLKITAERSLGTVGPPVQSKQQQQRQVVYQIIIMNIAMCPMQLHNNAELWTMNYDWWQGRSDSAVDLVQRLQQYLQLILTSTTRPFLQEISVIDCVLVGCWARFNYTVAQPTHHLNERNAHGYRRTGHSGIISSCGQTTLCCCCCCPANNPLVGHGCATIISQRLTAAMINRRRRRWWL